MAGTSLYKIPHNCGSSDGLQLFQQEDGSVDGFCFACRKYEPDPLKGQSADDFPVKKRVKKSKEEIQKEIDEISTYPVENLRSRMLRKESLAKYGIRLGFDETDGQTVKFMYFPYTRDGELVSYKTKLIEPKKFWAVGDQSQVDLFGWEQAVATGAKRLVIVEGECFTPDAEVFTKEGWVALKDWQGQSVMQVFTDQGGQFVKPLALVDKEYEGDLIEYKSGSYYSLTTPNHNLVRIDKEGRLFKAKAKDSKQKHRNIPRVILPNYTGHDNLDLRIRVMVSADFTLRKEGDLYACFKKIRKVVRAKRLLDAKGVRYSCNKASNGYWSFFIHRGHGLDVSRFLKWGDVLAESDREVMIDEILFWDGNSVNKRNQIEYSSKHLHNAEVVQAAAHLRGYVSTIMKRANQHGEWYKVSILFGKQTSSTQKGYRRVPYKGQVMCLTVPSGMLLVRQKGSVSISGNCDVPALDRILEMHTSEKWKDMIPAVASLPHGAASAGKDLARLASKIRRHFKDVSFCFDNDKAGRDALEAAMKVFPDATSIDLPCKDANQCIIDGKTKAAHKAVTFNASKAKNTRLVWGREVHEIAKVPAQWGVPWPWKKLTELTRGIRTGETYYLGAAQKMGKSEVVNTLGAWLIEQVGWSVMMAKPEEANAKTYKLVAGKIAGKIFHDPKVEFDEEAYDRAGDIIQDKLCMVNLYQHLGWETLQTDIRSAAAEGCKAIFIDPITNLTNGMNAADANTKLQEIAQELAAMAKDLDVAIFIFCHLRNPDSGLSHDRGGHVLTSQFAGSRAMGRSCNYMFGLEGNKDPELTEEERNVRHLVLLDDREFGEVGSVPLFWNRKTGLFSEM